MGRQKSTPTKLNNSNEQWSFHKPLDYIPMKRRKYGRRNNTTLSYNLIILKEEHKQFRLGELCVGNTSNVLPESWSKGKVTFVSTRENEHLILELDSTSIVVNTVLDTDILKEIFVSKSFAINVITANGDVYFDLYFVSLPLPRFTKRLGFCIQTLLTLFFHITVDDESADEADQSSTHAITQLYKNIKAFREKKLNLGCDNVQHPRLKPELRPYQADAVRWMLHREKMVYDTEGNNMHQIYIIYSPTISDKLHPLYTVITLKSGICIYYDKYSGYVDINKPVIEESSRGGILADEMGLGKTVEVLACILLHPKQEQNNCVSGEEGINTETSPTVDQALRKRKIENSAAEDKSQLIDEPKKLKIRQDWVKGSSKKSQTRVALEMWYNNCLEDVKIKNQVIKSDTALQCICGRTSEEDSVFCQDCGKIQHASCLGYKKKFGAYRCPQCWMKQPLIECGATLIVSPVSLRTQWCNEICKHIKGDFKVLQYRGSSVTPIYPMQLTKYDVVITTYNVLQSELRLTEQQNVVSFRNQRRYSPPGSPLTRIKWWRLCLDEAQTVETPTTMVSAMAKKLTAHFRWAVTGTPISKEISDLQGLIDYLQIEPYNDKFTWEHVLFNPYLRGEAEPMLEFLSQVLWRSSKDEIIDQINIPKQTIKEHWLQFSAVEQYFYKCEHQSSCDVFLKKAKFHDPNIPLQTLEKTSFKTVLAPLLSLRQVCTYPNSVRTRYLSTKKPVNSMKDLLEALIVKNTTENEEYLRIILSSLNGLAGTSLLLQCPDQAIEEYRKVLQLFTRFTEEEKVAKLTVDKLQVIHSMHNLAEILDIFPSVADRTLRDETLRKDCAELEQKYIEKFIDQSMSALQDSLLVGATVEKLQNSFILEAGRWYTDLLNWIYIHEYTEELYTKIENAHTSANVNATLDNAAFSFRNERRLLYSIAIWDENISELRQSSIDIVNDLYTHCPDDEFKIVIAQELVQTATDCHLRPQKKARSKKKCPMCVANDHLKSYELKLFSMTKRTKHFEEMSLKGSWKPTTEELTFKSILAVGRAKSAKSDLIKDGEIHINLLETLKKEFKEIRKLWTFLDQQICAQDELDICKIRLRLKEPNEEDKQQKKMKPMLKNLTYNLENKLETIHVLEEQELGYQRSLLHSEERQNTALLEKNLGIRSYLETLHKQQYEGQNPDPCPICKNALEQHWSILPCGHSYCLECIQLLIEQTRGHHVQCSVCRAYQLVREISYIKSGAQADESDTTKIKGNYSTKVESIIELILDLRSEDGDVKVLVFSSWISVLNYLKTALTNNDVSTELVISGNLEKQIERFKVYFLFNILQDPELNITALLLPIHLGSKGLNLVEATHVILTEPLLNSGDELQAIGRIHRIGQTRPTVVHKFFIKNTIEESIQKAISTDAPNWEKNKVTLRQLMDLFVVSDASVEETAEPVQSTD
ncbi:E3 ubiquitin-protein ligase SHPRH [Asbolus verrucosus]|uniref:E3 ubiquitin-protein ligase SHPRH n=1 Tax=Asbolus verrucosus TaxID=1661398 RepID=A0A482VXD9_ASBVE|nr:E3 ubiquitin-protein ligase SHPRH [Asbolus verrucosus]